MAGKLSGFPHLQYYDFEEMIFSGNIVREGTIRASWSTL